MDLPRVCWRRRGNLDVTSTACRKRGNRGRQSFLLQGRVFCSGQEETEGRQGLHGVGLAVKESICCKSVYAHQMVDERRMSMRFESTGECAAVNLVAAYAPSEANPNAELKEVLWKKLGHLVQQIPSKELLFVLMDANERTGKRMEGCDDGRVLGAY